MDCVQQQMNLEIERKFLVIGDKWRNLAQGVPYRQGYIATLENSTSVRVRVAGEQGYLTIKGKTENRGRAEFEYSIPLEDAQSLIDTVCDRPLIEKKRYKIPIGEMIWEIDEFAGDNEGLIIAEVELTDANQAIELPEWIGDEVTDDYRYYNVNLAKSPYKHWK